MRGTLIAVALLVFCGEMRCGYGQQIMRDDLKSPLIANAPFDLLTLDKSNEGAVLRIRPPENLKLPLDKAGSLIFEFDRENEFPLKIPNAAIKKYETFNDLLLAEANQFLDEDKFSLAFRNLLYVYDHGGKSDTQLVETLRTCLFLDARKKFENGEFEIALSIFEDLYQKDPSFKVPGINRSLIDLVLACYDGILNHKLEEEQFESIRSSLYVIESRYGNDAKRLVRKWRRLFDERADGFLKNAKLLASQGKGREAHLLTRKAERVSPGRIENETVEAEIMAEFPLIVVGVSQGGGEMNPSRMDHWGSRRVGRMIKRSLVEVAGLSDEGARYEFLNGTITRIDDLGLQYAFDLDENPVGPVPAITAYELATRLLWFAKPSNPQYDATWAKVLKTVEVRSQSRVVVTLQRPFVRPEALMKFPYPSESQESQTPQQSDGNGVYALISQDDEFSFFAANDEYDQLKASKHPVVIEQMFRSDSDAVDAMLNGEVDVLDRVPPSDIKRLKEEETIQVRPYLIPAVHLLIPKIRGKMAKSYRFLNALSTAIDREAIVDNVITGNTPIDGCNAISGPFPLGGDTNDQISYGYDLRVKPLKHNERLAIALNNLAIRQSQPQGQTYDPEEEDNRPPLVLVHQDSSLVRNCADAIARAWNAAGIKTTLRVLPPGVTFPPDDQWDVLYSELFIEEPVVDAIRMLGPTGMTDNISAPVEQSLRKLVTSQTWQGASQALRNIHRQIAVDLSVIPLYQVQEHFAFRDNVYNIGRNLIHLYQYVDRWQIETLAQAKKRKEQLENQ